MRRERTTFTHIPTINHKSIMLHFVTSDFSSLFFHIIFEIVNVYVCVDLVKWGVLGFVGEMCCYRSDQLLLLRKCAQSVWNRRCILSRACHTRLGKRTKTYCVIPVLSVNSHRPDRNRWKVGEVAMSYKTFALDISQWLNNDIASSVWSWWWW